MQVQVTSSESHIALRHLKRLACMQTLASKRGLACTFQQILFLSKCCVFKSLAEETGQMPLRPDTVILPRHQVRRLKIRFDAFSC